MEGLGDLPTLPCTNCTLFLVTHKASHGTALLQRQPQSQTPDLPELTTALTNSGITHTETPNLCLEIFNKLLFTTSPFPRMTLYPRFLNEFQIC